MQLRSAQFCILVQDEISTGLDSSTTFQIIKYLGDLTHTQKNTMLISLLQPAPESYNLFDNVMLIAEGRESLIFLKFFLCLDTSCQKTTSFLDLKPCISEACYRISVFAENTLIDAGHIIYHGPTQDAAAYFETLGFRCPERKGVADFLQEVTSSKVQNLLSITCHSPY